MKYEGIFFDLDGTLLPMDNDTFTKGYLGLLARAVAPYGFEPKSMVSAMWKGVSAMVKNDGSRPNCDVFWEVFAGILGEFVMKYIPNFDAFYTDGFHQASQFTAPTPLAAKAVALAHQKAHKVVLATNPLFPRVAVESRLSWIKLGSDDFDLVTDYSNSAYCKPNPEYYLDICRRMGVDPRRCLMVGNNAEEDIRAAQAAGLSTFLLTDHLIAEGEIPETPKGSFDNLISYLEQL
ncbi:MAG: HAD family hydrolase [Clostridia bacterium]|nr:HAD family hydrolase [Clostridia bacterium]